MRLGHFIVFAVCLALGCEKTDTGTVDPNAVEPSSPADASVQDLANQERPDIQSTDTPTQSDTPSESTLCDAFSTGSIAGNNRRLDWGHGKVKIELFIDSTVHETRKTAIEHATYFLPGVDALPLTLESTDYSLHLVGALDSPDKLARDVEIRVEYGGKACSMNATFKGARTWPTPQKRSMVATEWTDEGEARYATRRVGKTRLEYWGDSDLKDVFDETLLDALGVRCLYIRGSLALKGPCPLHRDSMNSKYVVLDTTEVVPLEKLWSYLQGKFEAFTADTSRQRFSNLGSVVTFVRWVSPDVFQLEAACCGDSEIFEYDVSTGQRAEKGPP